MYYRMACTDRIKRGKEDPVRNERGSRLMRADEKAVKQIESTERAAVNLKMTDVNTVAR